MTSGGPANPSAYQPNAKYVLLLDLMCALTAVTSDIYLPSLSEVARDLHTTTAVQLTMTGVLVGGAVGQLVVCPLSDRFGRRRPVLVGIALHIAISLLCALAPGIGILIALRVIQGLFNAAATVVAIAVIRDRFTGSEASRLLSRLMLVIGVAPLFAPTVGGLIAGQWGWRAVFVALAVFGPRCRSRCGAGYPRRCCPSDVAQPDSAPHCGDTGCYRATSTSSPSRCSPGSAWRC